MGGSHIPWPTRGEALLGITEPLPAIPGDARQVYVNWHF
jgi:hypothetical protein